MEQKVNKIVEWLQEQAREAGATGLVVGISGGIDSAVVAHLVKKAFPDTSVGIIMPIKSNPQDAKDAMKVVETTNIKHYLVDLSEAHRVLFESIRSTIDNDQGWNVDREKLGDANARARLRMTTLYTVGNNFNGLVVGTDNADEWYTGYFTKYGDGGVDLVPLVHLTKGEVREMAKYLGVHEDILNKAPSAGLWEGQTDESEMGTTYAIIDAYLKGEEIPNKDREIIENMHKRTEHKRKLAAAPPKEWFE